MRSTRGKSPANAKAANDAVAMMGLISTFGAMDLDDAPQEFEEEKMHSVVVTSFDDAPAVEVGSRGTLKIARMYTFILRSVGIFFLPSAGN